MRLECLETEKRQCENWKFLDSKILNKVPANGILQCILKYIKTTLGVSKGCKDCLMGEKSVKKSALLVRWRWGGNVILLIDAEKPFTETQQSLKILKLFCQFGIKKILLSW